MPQFQPYIQRANSQATTITAPDSLQQAMAKTNPSDFQAMSQPTVSKDVKMRRQQRWVFYVIFVLFFLAALLVVLKVYADNTKLTANVENLNSALSQRTRDLEQVRQELAQRNQAAENQSGSLEQLKQELANNLNQLQAAVAKNREYESELSQKDSSGQDQALSLERAKANTANLILNLGVELSSEEINKIPVANITVAGLDTDKDGLSDDFEAALGTDYLKADSDGDGYSDAEEIFGGFNPLGAGLLPLDPKLADRHKGKIVLHRRGEVFYGWYIGNDGQRYYLGNSGNKFEALRQNDYWTRER